MAERRRSWQHLFIIALVLMVALAVAGIEGVIGWPA
jgi:hypothetical protein